MVRLPVEQARGVGPLASASMVSHCSTRRVTSRCSSSALAPSAAVRTIRPWPGRLDGVDDPAQPLALGVLSRLEMPKRAGVRDQDHEPAGERDLLGQAGPLGPDRVLGDLAQDGLARAEQLLDPGLLRRAPALDVVEVVADVAAVEHGVLRGCRCR